MNAFPPFSLVGSLLQKVESDRVDVWAVLPLWLSQPWFGRALRLLVDHSVLLPITDQIVYLPQDQGRVGRIRKKLKLTLFPLSGNVCKQRAFQMTLSKSSKMLGEKPPKTNTDLTCLDGFTFATKGGRIQCVHLRC